MLNAGGILSLTDEKGLPLGMIMLEQSGKLQLGFGKVELKDISEEFSPLQTELDNRLKNILLKQLDLTADFEQFKALIKNNLKEELFSDLETILTEKDADVASILRNLATTNELTELSGTFGRPCLNPIATYASQQAAIREIREELIFDNFELSKSILSCTQALNRQSATEYVQDVLINNKDKFSAKEFNDDIESTTFVVQCNIDTALLPELTSGNCVIVKPDSIKIQVANAEKGFLATTLSREGKDFPPILGGGNQYTIALYCKEILGLTAEYFANEVSVSSPTAPGTFFYHAPTSSPLESAADSILQL